MLFEKARVMNNKRLGTDYYRIGLQCNDMYTNARPGQFIMLQINEMTAPLLGRPFSIHDLVYQKREFVGIEILYKVVGPVTKKMSTLKTDDGVHLLGPLGNGFSHRDSHQRLFIVAGGIGVAPLLFLSRYLVKNEIKTSKCKAYIGGRSVDDILCKTAFEDLGFSVEITTDDGSLGDQCLVTHPMEVDIKKNPPDMIYACGPQPMLNCVAGIANTYEIPCQLSIETMMACGIGACMGCAIESRKGDGGYYHACVDGPVFDANQLHLNGGVDH
jgi:dihydroorotate dehydrogenase electron transfer subunit